MYKIIITNQLPASAEARAIIIGTQPFTQSSAKERLKNNINL